MQLTGTIEELVAIQKGIITISVSPAVRLYGLKFCPLLPLLHLGLVLIHKYMTERLPSGRLWDLIEQTTRSVKR